MGKISSLFKSELVAIKAITVGNTQSTPKDTLSNKNGTVCPLCLKIRKNWSELASVRLALTPWKAHFYTQSQRTNLRMFKYDF